MFRDPRTGARSRLFPEEPFGSDTDRRIATILRCTRNIVHGDILDPGDLIPNWYTIISGVIAIVWAVTTPGGAQASALICTGLE
ncbi:hypothetical protein [Tistrella mobilis]|uniref:hypothetical protein n=1 Tax=Tistrella mobilis TaxID=171437 RepID=UPI0011AE303F|nr:hypothetical protein [Tistrella mobilis]